MSIYRRNKNIYISVESTPVEILCDLNMEKMTLSSKDTKKQQKEIPVKPSNSKECFCTCPYCDYEAFYKSFQDNFQDGKINPSVVPDLGKGVNCKNNKHLELISDHEILYRNIIKNAVAKSAKS